MNPFTQSLLKQVSDRRLAEFVTRWDALEALVVRVYKGNAATAQDEREYAGLRVQLVRDYPRWQQALGRFWPLIRAAGEPTKEDPFVRLLVYVRASDFVDNWPAMQTLPAARESINMLLIDVTEREQHQ
jgi:hypothetical protein